MAYRNFVPQFWAEKIIRENEKFKVYAQLTNRQYEGKVSEMGDTVHILGIGKPTIVKYTGADLPTPETLADTKQALVIDQADAFNIMIDDIDKRQAVNGVMATMMQEASEAMSVTEDTYVGGVMAAGAAKTLAVASLTKDNVRQQMYAARTVLYKQGVGKGSEIVIVVSPDFLEKLAQAVEGIDTDNSGTVKSGYVGQSAGIKVYLSNNVPKNTTKERILVMTKRATAHASQISKIEPYRMEKRFSDAVKGLNLYGTKVIRPKEIVMLEVAAYA